MQRKQLEELNLKREQMRMMLEWKAELRKFQEEQVDIINDCFKSATGHNLSEIGRKKCLERIKQYGLEEVYDATEIALHTYYDNTRDGAILAWNKVGGICYNRKKMKAGAQNGNI